MFAVLISPNTFPAHMGHTSSNGPNVTTGRKRATICLKCHLTYCKQAMTLQGARCLKRPTRRCGEVRKEAKRWGQSKTKRCKILFVAGSLLNTLSTDKGIMNSHVNLSPIKLSGEGSVGWNSESQGTMVTCQRRNYLEVLLTDEVRERGSFGPFFECIQINIHICALSFTSFYLAQLYLESMFPRPLKTT